MRNAPLAMFSILIAASACSKHDDGAQASAPPSTPSPRRIDALGLELTMGPAWKQGGSAETAPTETQFYRGPSADEPDAEFLVSRQDMNMSDDDADQMLFTTKQIGGQIVRAGGTCSLIQLGGRSVGRCQLMNAPVDKLTFAVPDGEQTYTFLFMARSDMTAEATAIVASLRHVD